MDTIKKIFRPIILAVGLIIIAISFGIAVVFLENDIATAIVTAGTTIFVSVFAAIWARDVEKSKMIEQQLREKKIPIYEEFIRIAFEVMFKAKKQNIQVNTKGQNQNSKVNEQAADKLQNLHQS